MSLKQLVVILALLTTVRAAVAQPGQSADPARGAPLPVAMQPPPPSALPPPPPAKEPRSTSVGVTLAVVGSILPAVAFGVGWSLEDEKKGAQVIAGSVIAGLVLPSLGMYYGGKKKTVGQYPRAAAVVAPVAFPNGGVGVAFGGAL